MSIRDFNTSFTVDQDPHAVTAAISNVRAWWSEGIFPDSASQAMAESWRNSVAKAMERQFATFLGEPAN